VTRVAILASTFPPTPSGGIAAAHHNLGRLLAKAGCEVRCFSFLDAGPPMAGIDRRAPPAWLRRALRKLAKLAFRVIDPSGAAYQTADILESFAGAWALRRPIAKFRPDHLILPDHGCPGLALGRPPSGCRVTLVSHHNPMRFVGDPFLNPHSMRDARFAVALENWALRHVDRVVAPSGYMAERFRATYAHSRRVEVIPNLVAFEELDAIPANDPRSIMGLGPEAPLLYIPSAGSRFKGREPAMGLISELVRQAPIPIGFFLSGAIDDALLKSFRSAALGSPIHAPGRLPPAENLAIAKTCSLAVSPTVIENFSMALLEAQLLGLPVAAFAVGGNAELIEPGVTGLLVERGDSKGLARAALDLLAPSNLDRYRARSRASARRRFDPAQWLPRWLA
jgi:glycosyltransferase involved in cell wall biosynthesis